MGQPADRSLNFIAINEAQAAPQIGCHGDRHGVSVFEMNPPPSRVFRDAAKGALSDLIRRHFPSDAYRADTVVRVEANGDTTVIHFKGEWQNTWIPRWTPGVPEIRALAGLPPVSSTTDPELEALRARLQEGCP